jgi:hypothetical protein
MLRSGFRAALAAALFSAAAAAEPADSTASAAAPSDQEALQAAADYANKLTPLITEATGLMSEMINLSSRFLLGFTEPEAYARDRAEIAAAMASLDERVGALRAKAAAFEDPRPGAYAARGLELKRYVEKFAGDMADMKAALDRLPGLVDAGDAEGFDAARAVLFRYSSNALRAENVMMTAGQLTMSLGHPEYHLIEAIKNSNLVIADFIDLMQRANAGERDGLPKAAAQIGAYHKGISISLDASASLVEKLKSEFPAQAPTLKPEADAFFAAYETAFGVERRIGAGLAEYPTMAAAIADGAAPSSFKARLDEISADLRPLMGERQQAAKAKQAAGVALASKSP